MNIKEEPAWGKDDGFNVKEEPMDDNGEYGYSNMMPYGGDPNTRIKEEQQSREDRKPQIVDNGYYDNGGYD